MATHLSDLPPLQGQNFKDARSSLEMRADPFGIPGYGMLSERDNFVEPEVRNFDTNDGEEAVKCLRKCFQVLNPGNHVAKRSPENGTISFVHCRHTSPLGRHYVHLRQVMEERARLSLLRDCVFRIKTATAFVKTLQHLVLDEHKMLYTITHDWVTEIPVSKISCLNGLCEDLRTQIGHWNCIKQKLHTDRWLQPILGSLYFELDSIRMMMHVLRDKAIYWMDIFIMKGLQVFAHSNIDAVSHELIWNITRGLEDFNNIVNGVHNGTLSSSSARSSFIYSKVVDRIPDVQGETSNSIINVRERISAIPFSKVLSVLANERSKYAALETHRFFTTNSEYVRLLYSGRLPEYLWTEESTGSGDKADNKDTSDYHTATGSMTSLSAAVLKVGGIRAPDLSNCNSPLVDLSRRELNFAENFLLIVCNSTNLLQKKDPHKSRRAVKISQSMSSAKPPRGDTPVLSRSDSLRKSVSWGDSADSSIRSQLTTRYMNQYWGHFGSNLQLMFYEPCWVRQNSLYFSELGTILLHNPTVVALVQHTMQHVCLKVSQHKDPPDVVVASTPDLFPPGSVTPMLTAVKKCLHTAAFGAWDKYMGEALGCHRSDKCYPCPLVDGDYSTRTGMLMRDTFQPMLHLLREHLAETQDTTANEMSSRVSEMVAITTRLLATSSASYQWCRCKTHQFLASMHVGNFLLVSQTDMKILVDEAQSSLYKVQMFIKGNSQKQSTEEQALEDLRKVANQLNVVLDNLQSLPGLCMKQFSLNCNQSALEYFKGNMPVGKVWKKKQDSAPKDHNIYIEHVLETVLEPVLEGVGKLKQTVQLSVVSVATEALCQAFMTFILQEKVKFSFTGACQLGMDIKYLKKWLAESIPNQDVQQSVLDLSVLKTLQGAVLLLMKQPSAKRSSSKIRNSGRDNELESVSDTALQGERSVHEIEDCIAHVTNPEEWLALRVQGGARGWRGLSSCLHPDS